MAAPKAGAPFEPTTVDRRELRADDIMIDIKFAGICHSDIHSARDEWGAGTYPMVPGHEIAGIVEAVGDDVTKFSVGDRVGVGCFVNSCGECGPCKDGDEQYCAKGMVGTYNSQDYDGSQTYGGYSEKVVVRAGYALPIPEGVDLDVAAPLLCAGITLYSPLKHWGAGPGKKVAVVGMGGLGHMGVKLAHAMGAEVTVLSQTLNKKADGERLGADHFYATSDPATFKEHRGEFDLILNTVSANLDMDKMMSLVARNGALVLLGMSGKPSTYNAPSLIGGRKTLAGSMIGGIEQTGEMLAFCAEHGIGSEVEVIRADQIDEAYERAVKSDVRYRFVIDSASFDKIDVPA